MNYEQFYARRAGGMKKSAIREFFSLTEQPDVVSFAGGFPSGDYFPLQFISEMMQDLLREEGKIALQYGPTEGSRELREYLAGKMSREGYKCTAENILITNGSQQGMDLIGKILIDPQDIVIVEEPGYVGGLGAIHSYQADRLPVPLDEEGLRVDMLAAKLPELQKKGRMPKFAYVVPNFQNPTGICMSLARRRRLLELAQEYDFLILEDNPYGEICFKGSPPPSIKSLDKEGRVIYLGSFSKTFCPGIRIGWMAADEELIEKIVCAKGSTDLCSNSLGQRIAYRFASTGRLDEHVALLAAQYKKKRDVMLDCMEKYFPEGVSWTRPEGGFFIWVTFPKGISAREILLKAIERKVAFVDGSGFYVNGNGKNTGRFAFSESSPEEIEKGIANLGEILREELQAREIVPCPDRRLA